MAISFGKRVSASPDVIIQLAPNGESVFLNLKTGSYFGLDEVGTSMWKALTSCGSIQDAYESLLTEYDVDVDLLRSDLEGMVHKLLENGLLQEAD